MRFTPAFLDELRARLPVSTVVGRKVRLKKEGREWRGLSPFTAEKTPSFFVNDGKGRWFDFSAGKNGDIVSFVMEVEGVGFAEAVERLAGEAGLPLPAVTRDDPARDARRATALDALETAAQFFEGQLRGRSGEKARAYLAERGIDPDMQALFRTGFASRDRFALRDHLAGKGVPRDAMIEAGLLIHGEDIEVPYDRFRDRVIFPIQDRSGRIIAFGGRTLDPAAQAKYLNSPETTFFQKGFGLYNHHRARRAAHESGRVIAVEGYVDVVAMTRAGFPETVAPLGTALTAEQCALLWSMSPEPILCFDGDKAGQKAAGRAVDTALPLIAANRTLRFAILPEGLDPDDLVRSGGATAIGTVINGARPLVEVLWLRERDSRPLDTPEQRTHLLNRLMQATEAISDGALRKAYQADLRGRAFDHFRTLRPQRPFAPEARNKVGRSAGSPVISASLSRSALVSGTPGITHREAVILTLLLDYPELIGSHVEEIALLPLPSGDADRLRQVLIELGHEDGPDPERTKAAIDAADCRAFVSRIAQMVEPMRRRRITAEDEGLDAAFALRQALALQVKGPALNNALRAALAAFDADPSDKNWEVLRDVRAQASSKDGLEASFDDRPVD